MSIVMIMDPDDHNIHAIDYMGSRETNFSAVTCFQKVSMRDCYWFGMSDYDDNDYISDDEDDDDEDDDSDEDTCDDDTDDDNFGDCNDDGCDRDDDNFLGC